MQMLGTLSPCNNVSDITIQLKGYSAQSKSTHLRLLMIIFIITINIIKLLLNLGHEDRGEERVKQNMDRKALASLSMKLIEKKSHCSQSTNFKSLTESLK